MTDPDNISLVTTPRPSLPPSSPLCHADGVSVANGQTTSVAGALAFVQSGTGEQSINSSSSALWTADRYREERTGRTAALYQNCDILSYFLDQSGCDFF